MELLLKRTIASAMLGFWLVFCTHVHLSVNGTPVKWNILSQSLQVPPCYCITQCSIGMATEC